MDRHFRYSDGTSQPFYGILKKLDAIERQRLELKPVMFQPGQRLFRTGEPIRSLIFPESGAVSLLVPFENGEEIEVGLMGSQSVLGATVILGDERYRYDAVAQIAGQGYKCSLEKALREIERSRSFRLLAGEQVRLQIAEATQLAGCNAIHSLSQRLARWLIVCRDRIKTDEIVVTQDAISRALGATRPSICLAYDVLRQKSIIDIRRGGVKILNPQALEIEACECFRVIRSSSASSIATICSMPDRKLPPKTPPYRDVQCSEHPNHLSRKTFHGPGSYVQ